MLTGIELIFRAHRLVFFLLIFQVKTNTNNPIIDIENNSSVELGGRITTAKRISQSINSYSGNSYPIKLSTTLISSIDFHHSLKRYYNDVAPDKITSIDAIMIEYRGDEQKLIDNLARKYNNLLNS